MYKERLKELREDNELKQYDLAKIIGLSVNTYSVYENEYDIMPIKHLNTISNYFNVSLDYVLKLSNKKKYENLKEKISNKLAGKRLLEFRNNNNLTQEKLARFLNVSQTTIAKYEKGINLIATPFLYKICKEYSISSDYLIGKVDN